jgi:hypothetical protein
MGVVTELGCDAFKNSIGAIDIDRVRLPLGVRQPVTRVIEARVVDENISKNQEERRVPIIPVLTSRDAVEINYNLQAVLPCPTDSLEEVFVLPLNIRLARCDFVGPITYWDAHVIKSKVEIDTPFSGGSRGVLRGRTQLLQSPESRPQ